MIEEQAARIQEQGSWIEALTDQVGRTAGALGQVQELIAGLIVLATVIGVDETTVNVAGRKQWLQVARTERLTAYYLHQSRGRVAVDGFGVLPGYTGTVAGDALRVWDGPIYAATSQLDHWGIRLGYLSPSLMALGVARTLEKIHWTRAGAAGGVL